MKRVFEYIDKNLASYIKTLEEFIAIPSVTGESENIINCARFLEKHLKSCGIESCVLETKGDPVVYGEILVDKSFPTILIHGHYDVQPAGSVGEWVSDPFYLSIRNGRMFGRGISDDKGQIFANIMGVEAYLRIKKDLPVNIKFLFEGEEETGSKNLELFLSKNKELLKADLMFGSDTHIHKDGLPIIYLGNKGLLQIELLVTTANSEIHSQNGPAVPNAAWLLIDILKLLCDSNGNIMIDDFYENVIPPTQEEIDAVLKIPFNEEEFKRENGFFSLLQRKASKGFYYDLIFEPMLNITGLRAGNIDEGMKSIIPHQACVKINISLVPNQDPYDILQKIKSKIQKENMMKGVEIKTFGTTRASRLPINNPHVEVLRQSIEEVWGYTPLIIPNCPGSNPGYIFEKHLGLNFILIPFGLYDENAHVPNENLPVQALLRGMKTTANIINTMGKKKLN